MKTADEKLDRVALLQLVWKNKKLLAACLTIAEKALEKVTFWPDEVDLSFLLSNDDRNCIGSAWRLLGPDKMGVVEKTGLFRRSKSEQASGRTIFQYQLTDRTLALAFIKRYNPDKARGLVHPQLNLGL